LLRVGSDGASTLKDDTDVVVGLNRKALEDIIIRLELNIIVLNEIDEIMKIRNNTRYGDSNVRYRNVIIPH